VEDVLRAVGDHPETVLAALDGVVVPHDTPMADGDELQITRVVTGGSADVRRAFHATLEDLPALVSRTKGTQMAYRRLADELALDHADNLRNPHDWAIYAFHAGLVARLVPGQGRVLDWGGYYGHVTATLHALGVRGAANYLLHVPPRYEPVAQKLAIPTLLGSDPNRLSVPDASQDAWISSGVFEHVWEDGVGDEATILADVFRVLRPGGLAFLWNLPTTFAPGDLAGKVRGRWYHERRFGAREIRSLLQAAGFSVLAHWRYGGTPLGLLLKRLAADPARTFQWDRAAASLPPLGWAANNHALVARKPSTAD